MESDIFVNDQLDEIQISDADMRKLKLMEAAIEGDDAPNQLGICNDCNVAMNVTGDGNYVCPRCHITRANVGNSDISDESITYITTSSGGRSYTYTNNSGNYSHVQLKALMEELEDNNKHSEVQIDHRILCEVANIYNKIQQLYINIVDGDGNIVSKKKFVKRGQVKLEIISAILFYKCAEWHVPLSEAKIAKFKGLDHNVFTYGKEIIKTLVMSKYIDMRIDTHAAYTDFINMYLMALNIPTFYSNFIRDLIIEANRKKICISSTSRSKITGAIAILVKKMQFPVDKNQIEMACDKTRKATFDKFVNGIEDNILRFIDVFERHNIAHGFEGRLKKK
jgi:hypothetical protein